MLFFLPDRQNSPLTAWGPLFFAVFKPTFYCGHLQSAADSPALKPDFDPLPLLDEVPAEQLWERYFSTERNSTEVRRLIQRLHKQKRYSHVIAALRAALFAGQPEPWMYEVLALTMEIENYPAAEVERVMLSMTDFSARDVQNLLGSAAYLVRLGAYEQALKLYRQVSSLEPTRPEPYLLGLRLAEKIKDEQATLWAATGLLTYYWFDDYEKQHAAAVKALRTCQLRLNQQQLTEKSEKIESELKRALQRDLQLKLVWSGEADLDLEVSEPLGTICSASQKYTAGGGALLHDGAGPDPAECYEQYCCAYAAAGYYTVTVHHLAGRIVGNRARLDVIRYSGTANEQRESVNILFDQREKKLRISLHEGRRTENTPIFEPQKLSTEQRRREALKTLADLRRQLSQPGPNRDHLNFQLASPLSGAVGYTPVVANVSSGVNLTATATVSADRRYVRIGLQPALTDVTDVFTFSLLSSR